MVDVNGVDPACLDFVTRGFRYQHGIRGYCRNFGRGRSMDKDGTETGCGAFGAGGATGKASSL